MAPHSAESFGTASRNVRHHPKASSIAAAARRSPSGSFAASPASRHHRRVSARHLSTTESASSVARTPPKNVTVSALIPARASFIIRCAVRSGMPASRRNPDHSPCAATARASSSTSAHASQLSTDFRCSAPASCASSARTAPLFEAAIFLRCAVTSRNAHHRRSRAASQLATFRSQIQANGQHVGRHESARGIDPISSIGKLSCGRYRNALQPRCGEANDLDQTWRSPFRFNRPKDPAYCRVCRPTLLFGSRRTGADRVFPISARCSCTH